MSPYCELKLNLLHWEVLATEEQIHLITLALTLRHDSWSEIAEVLCVCMINYSQSRLSSTTLETSPTVTGWKQRIWSLRAWFKLVFVSYQAENELKLVRLWHSICHEILNSLYNTDWSLEASRLIHSLLNTNNHCLQKQ